MPNYRSPNHNRLLALEQELLAKKRWAKELKSEQDIDDLKQEQTRKVSGKRQVNNRLLQLEQDILGKYRSKESQTKTSQARTLRVEKHKSDRIISSKNKSSLEQQPQRQKPKSKGSRVKSQVFDTGEAIILQYNSEALTVATPHAVAVDLPATTSMVDTLPIPDLPINNEKSAISSGDDSDKSPSLTETSISDKIEASTPELPVVPETVVANPKISTEMDRETEDSLSQAAELISKIDTQPYPLQAEDIPPIIAELESDRPEAPTQPVSPQKKQASDYSTSSPSDRKNPHDIFDRLGKNMAYATTFDVGTIELEQLFDEFDRTLELEEQERKVDSVSQVQSDRNWELEQRFDEFDRALELEEQVNKGDSVFQGQEDLELEQRFDEFDRTLEQQEKGKTAIEPAPQIKTPSEMISEKTDAEIQELGDTEKKAAGKITSKPPTDGMQDQNQQSVISPLASRQVELVQPLSHATKLNPNTSPKFDFKLEALLFRTGINLISLILWLLNLLCRKQIDWQSEIDSRSTLSSFIYRDREKNEAGNLNSQVIDTNLNDLTEEISPLILSSQRSSSLTKSTPVDAATLSRDPLTGMPNYEFTEQNSYLLSEGVQEIKGVQKLQNSVTNGTPLTSQFLFEKPRHPAQEKTNDSS
ncbi:MAG: hypothetical protein QNJ72_12920 [Pleurocapsa sp. MO_226.B13]|nr:hypothetical protein [Pleurocapsa sp. MO_226.B13]